MSSSYFILYFDKFELISRGIKEIWTNPGNTVSMDMCSELEQETGCAQSGHAHGEDYAMLEGPDPARCKGDFGRNLRSAQVVGD